MIRFFFVLLYSYLSDFAWIIRSKNFAKTLPLFPQHRSPCFASAKVLLFPFPQTLFKTFFYFFSLFLLHSEKQPVTRKKNMKKGAGTPVSRQKNASYGGRTGRKTSENITNPDFLRKNRTATTRAKHTDIDRKSGEKHMKRTIGGNAAAWTARSAWNRTDDNGPFARKDNETRKEKAHLIN